MSSAQSKIAILNALRENIIPPVELPSLDQQWIRYDDPVKQFTTVLEAIGGSCHLVASPEAAWQAIRALPVVQEAKQIVSTFYGSAFAESADFGTRLVDMQAIADPHQLEAVDVAILSGEFGVAENGAVWCDDVALRHRVVYFLSQYVVLLVPRDQIVHNMHEAYARLKLGAAGFGMFLAGPSKTADIEQSLVIGAHGARSLTVYLC